MKTRGLLRVRWSVRVIRFELIDILFYLVRYFLNFILNFFILLSLIGFWTVFSWSVAICRHALIGNTMIISMHVLLWLQLIITYKISVSVINRVLLFGWLVFLNLLLEVNQGQIFLLERTEGSGGEMVNCRQLFHHFQLVKLVFYRLIYLFIPHYFVF